MVGVGEGREGEREGRAAAAEEGRVGVGAQA